MNNIQQIPTDSIKPYELNAKKHPKKQVQKIADSIQEFGFNQPIVVDDKNVVIVGHGRLEAAKLLGLLEVPVVKLNLTEEQAKAYRLADNKLNESDWDMELVIQELKELDAQGFDIELTGFEKDLIIELTTEDDTPDLEEETDIKLGDVYQLGDHRIMCGDSTSQEDIAKLMRGSKADMVFTDPPYNVDYKGKGEKTKKGILNDKMSDEAFQEFMNDTCASLEFASHLTAPWYICHNHKAQIEFEKGIKHVDRKVKAQIIWVKPNGTLGMQEYRSQHEVIFYAVHEDQKVPFYGDRTNTTVWKEEPDDLKLLNWAKKSLSKEEESGGTTIWKVGRDDVNEYKHPTQKPVALVARALHNSSKPKDIVLDLFLGSGSTLLACQVSNRVCYGMEMDPLYVQLVIDRWEEYTGQTAEKLEY